MKMTKIKLYDLAASETDRCFHPNCWQVRLALLHKRLPFETMPWQLTDQEVIDISGQGKVPVIVDGEHIVYNSWAIAEYLEESYPESPSLFDALMGKTLSRFVTDWVEAVLNPQIVRLMITDLYSHLHPQDQDYFQRVRTEILGDTLESISNNHEEQILSFRRHLIPLRKTLQRQPFLAGRTPAWVDYVVFSSFQWARCVSSFPLLLDNDPVFHWQERMLDAFDGETLQALAYPNC
jgi:glutathione S-transferase